MPKDRGAEQGDVDGPLQCSLALGTVAAETRGRVAAQQASGSLPWIGVEDPSEARRLQANHAVRFANFQFGGPEKFTGAEDPLHALQQREAWRTCGTWTTVTSCVTRSWCRLTCRTSTSPMPKLEQSENLRERKSSVARTTWVQHLLSGDLVTCRAWPRSPQYPLGASHSKSLSDLDSSSRTSSWQRRTSFEPCTHGSSSVRTPQTEFALLRESLGVSCIKHILRVHGHTILQEQRAAEIYDELGQRSLERFFPGFHGREHGTGHTQRRPARDIAALTHLGALVAAKPRIQATFQDAVAAGLLPKHSLEARLERSLKQPPPPTSKPLTTKTEPRPGVAANS